MTKIGIIICDRYRACAGGKCLRAMRNREGAFERYEGQPIELVGYTSCGGCPGGNIEYAPAEMKKNGAQIIHLATGVLIAVFLGIHMVGMHLDAILGFFGIGEAEPTAFSSMMGRSVQGVWMGFYIALLAFALYHGLNGLRGVILESTSSVRIQHIVTRVIIAFGIIAFIGGTYVPVALWTS